MTDLESVLKASLERASSHSKKVYGKNPLTAQEVLDLANSRALMLAATVRPGGRPHLSPTDIVAVDGRLYLGVDVATARHKNLKQNPAITVMMADGWKRQAILEGMVTFLEMTSQTTKAVREAQRKKYGWITDALAELSVEKAFTWKQ